MNNVKIIVLPSDFSLQNLMEAVTNFKATCGSIFSTKDKINVNKVNDGYSILYKDDEFTDLDFSVFAAALIKIFSKNIPGEDIEVELFYMFIDEDEFDRNVASSVLYMDHMLYTLTSLYSLPVLHYKKSKNMDLILNMLNSNDGDDEGDDFDIFTGEGVNFNPDEYFMSMGNDDEGDGEDDNDDLDSIFGQIYGKKKKKTTKKKEYDRSKVLSNAKSPKRSVNRHGVIIADSKSDISKDIKIIKEFLKDFIPGNQSWKKEFRNELVMRWINVYAITKKNLKKLENKQRKQRRKKIESDRQKRLINLSRQVFTVPVDRWSDPNR